MALANFPDANDSHKGVGDTHEYGTQAADSLAVHVTRAIADARGTSRAAAEAALGEAADKSFCLRQVADDPTTHKLDHVQEGVVHHNLLKVEYGTCTVDGREMNDCTTLESMLRLMQNAQASGLPFEILHAVSLPTAATERPASSGSTPSTAPPVVAAEANGFYDMASPGNPNAPVGVADEGALAPLSRAIAPLLVTSCSCVRVRK